MRPDESHEPEITEELKKLLELNAHNFLREDMPKLYATIAEQVTARKSKESIIAFCARIKGMNEFVMNSIEMTIDHLEREGHANL